VTVFVSGEGADPRKGPKIQRTFDRAWRTGNTVLEGTMMNIHAICGMFQLDEYVASNPKNQADAEGAMRTLKPAPVRPFGPWFKRLWPDLHRVVVCWTSIFAVNRAHITHHPLAYYQRLEAMLNDHPNPEVGHYMERSWGAVFWPYGAECIYPHEIPQERRDPPERSFISRDMALALCAVGIALWFVWTSR